MIAIWRRLVELMEHCVISTRPMLFRGNWCNSGLQPLLKEIFYPRIRSKLLSVYRIRDIQSSSPWRTRSSICMSCGSRIQGMQLLEWFPLTTLLPMSLLHGEDHQRLGYCAMSLFRFLNWTSVVPVSGPGSVVKAVSPGSLLTSGSEMKF